MVPPRTGSRFTSRTYVYVALAANLLVAATKFAAASWTGSSAMYSEGIHSVADMGNELLLLYGMHRGAARPAHVNTLRRCSRRTRKCESFIGGTV